MTYITSSVCLFDFPLSVCLHRLFLCLSVCLALCLSVSVSVCLSACLFVCLSVCLFVCLSVLLSVCLLLSLSCNHFHFFIFFYSLSLSLSFSLSLSLNTSGHEKQLFKCEIKIKFELKSIPTFFYLQIVPLDTFFKLSAK